MLSHHIRAVCVMKTVLQTTNAVSLTVELSVSPLLSVRATMFNFLSNGQLLLVKSFWDWTGVDGQSIGQERQVPPDQKPCFFKCHLWPSLYILIYLVPLSQARSVSSQALGIWAVCWVLLQWQRLPQPGEVLPQWMWTWVHCPIHRLDTPSNSVCVLSHKNVKSI